jgi:hypothetical protein
MAGPDVDTDDNQVSRPIGSGRRQRTGELLFALCAAVGTALIIVGLGGTTGWEVFGPGVVIVCVGLIGLWFAARATIREAPDSGTRGPGHVDR